MLPLFWHRLAQGKEVIAKAPSRPSQLLRNPRNRAAFCRVASRRQAQSWAFSVAPVLPPLNTASLEGLSGITPPSPPSRVEPWHLPKTPFITLEKPKDEDMQNPAPAHPSRPACFWRLQVGPPAQAEGHDAVPLHSHGANRLLRLCWWLPGKE